ncbi:MAG TPA: DUF502 domain-containing protein [Mesorhizobium sp.]|jgi:uncharacterized membrane protein|nr:DUF502 domain-containing protein [Mesorhizobium sp.]
MFKRYLIAGLLVWIPLAITFWLLELIVSTMDQTLLLLPPSWRPDALLTFHIPGFGLLLTLLVVLATGVLAANIIGERLVRWWHGLLNRIPIVRSIYSSVKQISDTLLATRGQSFRKVVMIEFPQRGQWTLGFVVGSPGATIAAATTADAITVYVPTAPNPTSGYVLVVRPEDVREVDISVDDALKFHISLGVVPPRVNGRAPRSALTATGPAKPVETISHLD